MVASKKEAALALSGTLPKAPMIDPDVSSMAHYGLLETLVGQWEITLDEGTYIWGRVVIKSLKEAVIVTDEIQACKFEFRQRAQPHLRAIPGVESVVTIQWGDGYAMLEKCEQDFLTWRSPPLPDGSLGQHNVWKRIASPAGARAGLADAQAELAQLRGELEKVKTKASEDCAKAAQELARLKAELSLSAELADERGVVADEIAEENESLRGKLDAQMLRYENMKEELQALQMSSQMQTSPLDLAGEKDSPASMSESTPKAKKDLNPEFALTPKAKEDSSLDFSPEAKVRPQGKNVRHRTASVDKKAPPAKKRRTGPGRILAALGA